MPCSVPRKPRNGNGPSFIPGKGARRGNPKLVLWCLGAKFFENQRAEKNRRVIRDQQDGCQVVNEHAQPHAWETPFLKKCCASGAIHLPRNYRVADCGNFLTGNDTLCRERTVAELEGPAVDASRNRVS